METLIDLATDYLKVAAKMSERAENQAVSEYYSGYNAARRECILAVEKMLGEKKLTEIIDNICETEFAGEVQIGVVPIAIARAIREAVLGRTE